MLPVAHWWSLREKFKHSIPGIVTANYLATVLNMKVQSANDNVLIPLKTLGLVDNEGKTQELSKRWRDDEQYPEVCKEIREAIYPNEIRTAFPSPNEDRESVERWFANDTGKGITAVRRMVPIYLTISEADVSKKPEKKGKNKKSATRSSSAKKSEEPSKPEKSATIKQPASKIHSVTDKLPSININLEIHISSDASPDQIDKIFQSIAKHIYKND